MKGYKWKFSTIGSAAVLAMAVSGAALGASGEKASIPDGYVVDSSGDVVTDTSGDCVRTSSWEKSMAIAQCDPDLVAKAPEPAPAPEPVAVAEPAPEPQIRRVERKIELNADTYFSFDRAELNEEGKAKVREIAKAMEGTRDPTIHITGHTDFIGSEQYNQQLAQARAQAVRDQLVSEGVPEGTITVTAAGEGPTNPEECRGMRGDALIQCLQPYRRSDVEFAAFEIVEESVEQK